MYRLVLISNVWYCTHIEGIEDDLESLEEFVGSGVIVVICDDVEYFADEIGISLSDIVEAN
jgi:hypothetical protein